MREPLTPPLRELLRDTVLHLALIADGAGLPAPHCWRARCITLVDELTAAMRDAGYSDALIDEVGFAQCVLLDDATLRALPPERRNDWSRALLQARYQDNADRVDAARAMIERAAGAPDPLHALRELHRILVQPEWFDDVRNNRREAPGQPRANAARNLRDGTPRSARATTERPGEGRGSTERRRPRWRSQWAAALLPLTAAAVWFAAGAHVDRTLKQRLGGEVPVQVDPPAANR